MPHFEMPVPSSSRSPREPQRSGAFCRDSVFRSRTVLGFFGIAAMGLIALGCSCEKDATPTGNDEDRDPVTGLSALEAKEVLAKVGDRSITLGDYAATLLRMDRFERLRYQTEESQKKLLDEMIEVEILAQEAKRRGLDKDPEVQLRLQQALRDEVLRKLETEQPGPEAFSEREVLDYYESHRSEFKEPERRRVQVIRVPKKSVAEKLLETLEENSSGESWGKLALEYSSDRTNLEKDGAHELAGDLGFVSAPGQERGANLKIPDEVRAAVFQLEKVGDFSTDVVEAKEAERTIRVELRRLKFLEAEKALETSLRAKYPVVIDEKAIAAYKPPTSEKSPAYEPSAPVPVP
jgi:peptidyl-prolyl cis-trans isomerase C